MKEQFQKDVHGFVEVQERRGMIGYHQVLKVEVNITGEVGKVRNLK
jgi:hypothetical protein